MSNVVAEHGRARDVLARAALRMLDGKWAAFRIAVFRSSFSRERRSVAADLLHQQVDTHMAELIRDGKDAPPTLHGNPTRPLRIRPLPLPRPITRVGSKHRHQRQERRPRPALGLGCLNLAGMPPSRDSNEIRQLRQFSSSSDSIAGVGRPTRKGSGPGWVSAPSARSSRMGVCDRGAIGGLDVTQRPSTVRSVSRIVRPAPAAVCDVVRDVESSVKPIR